jgi:PilZ domain-containing protein
VRALHGARIAGMPFALASPAAAAPQAPDDGAAEQSAPSEVREPAGGHQPAAGHQPVGGREPTAGHQPGAAMAVVGHQSDRRSVHRGKVFKRGQILIPNLHSAIECTIRDISSYGARLRVDGHFVAPERFELLLSPKDGRKRVQLRWQIGNELGVQFEP